jgi:ABC-2 type transport system permease protein
MDSWKISLFALSTKRNDIFNPITSILYFLILFARNLFYLLEPLPGWFRVIALANPVTWQIDCLRSITIGLGNANRVALESAGFVLFSHVCFLYAARCQE